MIPAILHYVWVGGPLPDKQRRYIDTWREFNPTFQIQAWNEDNIDMSQPIIRDAYARKKWAKVADIARLQAVLDMGGIYLDTDIQVCKPLDSLRDYACFFAFQEDHASADWVCNGAFGAEPNHWFVRKALRELHAMKSPWWRPERPTDFGPKHVTRLLREAGLSSYSPHGVMVKDVFVAPVPVFFPFHHTEQFTPECVREETLAIHFWEKSWEGSVPLPFRMAKRAGHALRHPLRTLGAARAR